MSSGGFPRIFTIFAKNTAHDERRLRKNAYICNSMIKTDNTIESQIAAVLDDIRQKGFSSVQPFSIGKVEARMSLFPS